MKILVTGAAGFIGYHTARALLERGDEVVGIDNLNDYYDPALKRARLRQFDGEAAFRFTAGDVADAALLDDLFRTEKPQRVIHLAAQAGVRYGLDHPQAYIQANLVGMANILEACRHNPVEHLVFASSSSVYGANRTLPFSEQQNVDHPLSLYAATKKSNELMAHTYAHLFGLPVTGLRFFTVYGPWGRPDMALFKFTRAIIAGEPIEVYNNGNHARDFTYIDDIVQSVVRVCDLPPSGDPAWTGSDPDPARSSAPYRIFNIGNNSPVELEHFIVCVERAVGRTAIKIYKPMQAGDVERTFADVDALATAVGYRPYTPIEEGVSNFVAWYRAYYGA